MKVQLHISHYTSKSFESMFSILLVEWFLKLFSMEITAYVLEIFYNNFECIRVSTMVEVQKMETKMKN